MARLIFIWCFSCFTFLEVSSVFAQKMPNQTQDFEASLVIETLPNEFLPGWYGNDVRSGSSRIFQSASGGRNGSRGLAVQPISTFNGEVIVRLINKGYSDPKVRFWAKSSKNGSGNRPALVSYSWSEEIGSSYSESILLGGNNGFANENQEFRLFEISVTEQFKESDSLFLRLEINYGAGSGSCARWIMDDFEYGDFFVDKLHPKIDLVRGYDEKEIQLQFSERLDPIFSEFIINYKLDGVEPSQAVLKSDSLVHLRFENKLENGGTYELEVSQIPDLAGNFLQDTVLSFQFYDPTSLPAKSIIINELMPSPKADLDLPNVEYVELYYLGDYPIRLGGMTWANSKNQVFLPDQWVNPGEYLILASENQGAELNKFGRIILLKSWPTLLNSGDILTLKDDQDNQIDQIQYRTANWGGSEFANGGYSLEVKNPFYACAQNDLLQHSLDPLRGTPGRRNSVYDPSPDLEEPRLLNGRFITPQSLLLEFSKSIYPDFSSDNFSFEPSLTIDSVYAISTRQLHLVLKEPVQPNILIRITVNGLKDCSSNVLIKDNSLELVLPKYAETGDLLINELLYHPKTGSPKFVELINVTDNYLEIGNWKLANLDVEGNPDQAKILSETSLILPPNEIIAITTDPNQLKLDYPRSPLEKLFRINALPSYPIAGGMVVLTDGAGNISDQFRYSEDLHHPLLREPKGVSLERLSTASPANLNSNWHSASAAEDFATPGRQNSQVLGNEYLDELIHIDPEVFDPEGTSGETFTTIRYQLDKTGWIGTFEIYSISGRLIQVLAQNEILGTSGHYTWYGVDMGGDKVRIGYYVLLVELYELGGEEKQIKKTIVVATQL